MFGYAWGQLLKAFDAAASDDEDQAARAKVRSHAWIRVLTGMFTGRVRVGAPVPVRGFPDWLTPEIVRGGFATGAPAAGGPLAVDERALAREAGVKPSRGALHAWFLTDAGLARLAALLDSGGYRVDLPEHGALLVVAHLLRSGDSDAATELLDILQPWARHVRFWPWDAAGADSRGVQIATVPEVARLLARKRPRAQIEAQREALTVWGPFTDRVVAHWWLTRGEQGEVDAVVPAGWAAGAQTLLEEYSQLAVAHTLTSKHADPKGNLQTLLRGFRTRIASQSGPPLGAVRHAIGCIVEKRGEPGSEAWAALRAAQSSQTGGPSHADLAHEVAAALVGTGIEGGVRHPESLVEGMRGALLPSVRRHLRRATRGPLEDLLRAGLVPSAEALASMAPDLAAETVESRYTDDAVGRLAGRIFRAFANRRSVLLVDHRSQVRVESIPWFAALEREADRAAGAGVAHAQAAHLATLAVQYFPGTVLPNSLLRELARLYALAGEEVPLTYELAADIFTGTFSPVFLRAAQEAAAVVNGTVYARYYDIDYTELAGMRESVTDDRGWFDMRTRHAVPEFDELVHGRVGAERRRRRGSPALNGRVIEQAQILTTHNLASLLSRGAQVDPKALAQKAWTMTRAHLARDASGRGLRHRKNAAAAWRQTVFYLSIGSPESIAGFLHANRPVRGLPPTAASTAELLLRGLEEATEGSGPREGSFHGWVARST